MNICVLQPDYSTSDVDYQQYDPPRDLSHLLPEAKFTHVFLNKLTTYKQLKNLDKQLFDIFVNLCEGYLEWSVPSIDVVYTLELLNMPFTGPTTLLYDPPKELMKYVAYSKGINTPAYTLIESTEDVGNYCKQLKFPLFIKPAKTGDSLGIDKNSLVQNVFELNNKISSLMNEYSPILVEEFIAGREFTVMVAAKAGDQKNPTVFQPVEYIFPEGYQFKTYALKTSELHLDANIPVTDKYIEIQLKDCATKIFNGFNGVGYARMDFRMDNKGVLYFLEINFTCSVFYKDGYEGSADYILKHDGFGQAKFLQHIIEEGIYRHQIKQKKYTIKGNSISGFGIYATRQIAPKEIVFKGEGASQRIITRNYVMQNWGIEEKETFNRYAYPLSKEEFLLWDDNMSVWAPQNHSCSPNTHYQGLDVIALKLIEKGEELTLDYASIYDENMVPFQCRCGVYCCRGLITGISNNSVTEREIA